MRFLTVFVVFICLVAGWSYAVDVLFEPPISYIMAFTGGMFLGHYAFKFI